MTKEYPGLNSFDDRHGKRRHYFRSAGAKPVPIPGVIGSVEFVTAYLAARADADQRDGLSTIGASKTLPGTVNALAVTHYESVYFKGLALSTQNHRRRSIEKFRAQHGNKRVAKVEEQHIAAMLAKVSSKLTMQRHWLQAIDGLFDSAVPAMRPDNPCARLTITLPKGKGWHRWLDTEIEQYRNYWPYGTEARLVLEFALEAYSRRCEVPQIGHQHIRGGRIKIERAKGSNAVDIRLADMPQLAAAIDAMPKPSPDNPHLYFLADADGQPRTARWLGTQFAKWATDAGLPKRCRLHGLKKAGMTADAHDGVDFFELQARSGHRDAESVLVYTREIDQQRMSDRGGAKRLRAAKRRAAAKQPGTASKQNQSKVTNLGVRKLQTRS